jgi:hypothetical protein
MLLPIGPLQSVVFKRVTAAGFDVYEVKFEHKTIEFLALLDAQGRVDMAQISR